MRRVNKSVAAFAVAALAVTAACESERDDEGDGEGEGTGTFVFGTPGDPTSLDPSLATDGETFRITRQVYDTLIEHESGGTELAPSLATEWTPNEAGTEWTFTLREGVTFHDGEAFNAEAVCANFDRWYNWTGTYQAATISTYWQDMFGGFAENESEDTPEPNFVSCEATAEFEAVITLDHYSANYPGAFSLAAFSIHSPASIEAYAEQEISGEGENISYPTYSQEVGTVAGTGPFRYAEWNKANQEVVLERNDDYWGEPAGVESVIFRTIDTENDRLQALQAGDIHGYDLVAPADVTTLEEAGFQVPVRDVFNVLYMAFNPEANEALADYDVRYALSQAVNRQNLVDNILPEGGKVATQFMPDTMDGWNPDIEAIPFDTAAAESGLAEAGADDLTVQFCYPTDVTRPYMPAPEDIFQNIRTDLEAAGVTVEPTPLTWSPDFLDTTEAGGCEMYILGWTGDYNEGYNFIGTWFAGYDPGWGFRDDTVFDALSAVNSEPDAAARATLTEEANRVIMDYLPGLPLSSSPPSIAFSPDVNPPNVSPLTQEDFSEVSFK